MLWLSFYIHHTAFLGKDVYKRQAVSLVALSPDEKQILLIQQYGEQRNVLVAGYVNQKESVEDAVCREMTEEIGRRVVADVYKRQQ